jgi:hypothetical protein
MAISYRKAVGPSTPVLIADLATTTGGPAVLIHHNGGGNVFIGSSDVTATSGFSLASGSALGFVIDGSEVIYGITSTTTLTVQVFRTNRQSTPFHA